MEADLQAADADTQRNENNKLREQIEQLKGELEHRALKGDFNCNARVLHLVMNPTAIAEKQAEEKQLALLREVEELRAKMTSGNYGATTSSLHAQGKHTHKYLNILFTCFSFFAVRIFMIFNFVRYRNHGVEAIARVKDNAFKGGFQSVVARIQTSVLSVVWLEGRSNEGRLLQAV